MPNEVIEREKLRLVDHYTDELFLKGPPAVAADDAVVATVCRLVVDCERFADDAAEPAAAVGMGACYVATTEGGVLRELTPDRRDALLSAHYHPHHARLDELAQRALDSHGRCVILDCHSFPVEPLPTQTDMLDVSPEICVGTDPRHTSPKLRDLVVGHFVECGFGSVLVDQPFRGALVPNRFYGKDERVESVMVEIRRDLYMDEATREKCQEGFARVQNALTSLRALLQSYAGEDDGGRPAPVVSGV